MLGLLERYIGKAIAKATGMTLLVLVILLVFFNLVEELDQVNRGDYQMQDALLVAFLTAPRYLFEVFPISALLGALLGLGGLAARSELVAMRAAGFSVRDIVLAVLKIGLLMMLAVALFSELLAPPAERYAQRVRAEKLTGQPTLATPYGYWARDGRAFINIRTLSSDTGLRDVYIYEFDADNKLRLATHADSAEFSDNHWTLHGISQSELAAGEVKARSLASAQWDSLLDPNLLSVVLVRPTMLPIWELAEYIGFMRDNAQAATEYEVAFWLKVVNPIATLAMLFLAVPLVVGNRRGSSMGHRIFLGAVIGSVFFMLTRALSYIAVVFSISPMLTSFVPAAMLVAATVALLRRVR